MGVRFGIFLSGSALANAYGGALAYGIARANANISGWRLLFIIEGVPTVLLAAIGFYCLPDRAETARFLNAREREIAVAFAGTQPGEADKNHVDVKKLFGALTDPHSKSMPECLGHEADYGQTGCLRSLTSATMSRSPHCHYSCRRSLATLRPSPTYSLTASQHHRTF